jgi:hypothetical protein
MTLKKKCHRSSEMKTFKEYPRIVVMAPGWGENNAFISCLLLSIRCFIITTDHPSPLSGISLYSWSCPLHCWWKLTVRVGPSFAYRQKASKLENHWLKLVLFSEFVFFCFWFIMYLPCDLWQVAYYHCWFVFQLNKGPVLFWLEIFIVGINEVTALRCHTS